LCGYCVGCGWWMVDDEQQKTYLKTPLGSFFVF
jgi:hypothetical protein